MDTSKNSDLIIKNKDKLKKYCLTLDPFNEENRQEFLELLQSMGIEVDEQSDDPFALTNIILKILEEK